MPRDVESMGASQEKAPAAKINVPDASIRTDESGANIPNAVHDNGAQTAQIPNVLEELARIRNEMPAIFERAAKKVLSGELELIGWGLSQPRVQKLAEAHAGKPWFYIGDIHGDFLAWHCLLGRARRENDFRICFLGDLIDRGPLHIECFAALLDAAEKHPGQILWILGNHDAGVRWDQQKQIFSAGGVEPAEFVDWLNGDVPGYSKGQIQAWGKLFEDVSARLPRAVLFPDGTLATHGGVPLKDRLEFLKTMEAFHHRRCLEDFIWTRIRPYPRKLGWQLDPKKRERSSDFEIGYKDLEDFCRAVEPVLPVRRIVRGHDHLENGFEIPPSYKEIPVLTINGFGFDYLSGSVRSYRRTLVVGIGRFGELPRLEEVAFTPEEHAGVYPATVKPEETAAIPAPSSAQAAENIPTHEPQPGGESK